MPKLPKALRKRIKDKNDLTKPTQDQLSDIVEARTKAGAKTEGRKKKKKEPQKRERK